jgi:hypothetical protein
MDMKDEWLAALRRWAMNNDCVRELWLFGSRAKGRRCYRADAADRQAQLGYRRIRRILRRLEF